MSTNQKHKDKALRRANYAERIVDELVEELTLFHETTDDALALAALERAEEVAEESARLLKAARRLFASSLMEVQ